MHPAHYRSEILRCVTLPGVAVDICRFEFDALHDTPLPMFDDHHVLGLSLTAQPRNSAGRYAAASMEFAPASPVTFKPAGLSVLARNDGGAQTMLRCRFAEERLRTTSGAEPHWAERDLPAFLDVTAEPVIAGLRRLAHELERPGAPSRPAIERAASLLAIDFMRSFAPRADAAFRKGGLAPHQFSRLRARLDDEARPVASVGELAALLGMSERHLLRGFRTSAGTGLRERLQTITAARGRDWLAGEMPLKEIARRLGYSSQASFSTAFARCTGEAPSAYRRRTLAARSALSSEPPKPVPRLA